MTDADDIAQFISDVDLINEASREYNQLAQSHGEHALKMPVPLIDPNDVAGSLKRAQENMASWERGNALLENTLDRVKRGLDGLRAKMMRG